MLVEKVINIFPIKSSFLKLLFGSILTAIILSLGIVFILVLIHYSINPAIPSTFAAIGAAIYAAKFTSTSGK